MIRQLDRVVDSAPDRPQMAGPDHPIRKMTQQVAFESGAWTPERAAKAAGLFDSMASEWHNRTSAERQDVLRDALARGGKFRDGLCVEIGSGTGSSTPDLASRFSRVVSIDLSREMLRHAPADPSHRVQGDAAVLPLPDACADCVVLVNALLFPAEMNRVLAPGGALIWVSSLGEFTPIFLDAGDVAKALPGDWSGVAAEAGWGTWSALLRTGRVTNRAEESYLDAS